MLEVMAPLLLVLLSCSADAGVDLSPEAWRKGLAAARPGDHDAWLARLHLAPVTGDGWEVPRLETVELVSASLSGRKNAEVLVKATFTTRLKEDRPPLDPGVRLYRVQVLQREGARWCALSAALSEDVVTERPNAGPADGMKDTRLPTTFSLVHFSHPGRETLEVKKPYRSESRANAEGINVEWWDVVDGVLTQVMATSSATMDCGACEPRYSKSWFELRGSPPVSVVRFTRACAEPGEKSCEPVTEEHFAPVWRALP
jgi:hypothetical protein